MMGGGGGGAWVGLRVETGYRLVSAFGSGGLGW